MDTEINVQMTEEALFDFMLYHTYSKFSGFLINILGVAVILMGAICLAAGKADVLNFCFYVIAGVLFLTYTPVQLKRRAKNQVKNNPEYSEKTTYSFTEEGIVFGGVDKTITKWEDITKVVAAPKTMGFYYESEKAHIIPKLSFGSEFMPMMKIVYAHVKRERIQIR